MAEEKSEKKVKSKKEKGDDKGTSKEVSKEDASFLQIWATKSKKTVDEVQQMLDEELAKIQEAHPQRSEEENKKDARKRLYVSLKGSMRTNAEEWLIHLDWISSPFDFGNKAYQAVMAIYNKNAEKAKAKKLVRIQTDETGKKHIVVPLDQKPFYSDGVTVNKHQGKPLPEHSWIQSIGGLAIPMSKVKADDWSYLRPVMITISKKQADPTKPEYAAKGAVIGNWYTAKLSIKKTKGEVNTESWELNAGTQTRLVDYKGQPLEIDNDDIPERYAGFYVDLGELDAYHEEYAFPDPKDEHKTTSRRIVVTRGNVVDVIPGENGGNTRIIIDSETLGMQENPESVTCWYPGDRKVPFGKFSEIYAIGDTNKQQRKDLNTDEWQEEWQLPSIGLKGFIVIDLVEPEVSDEEAGDDEEDESDEVDDDDAAPNINADGEEEEDEEEEEKPKKPTKKPAAKPVKKAAKKPAEKDDDESEDDDEESEDDDEESEDDADDSEVDDTNW